MCVCGPFWAVSLKKSYKLYNTFASTLFILPGYGSVGMEWINEFIMFVSGSISGLYSIETCTVCPRMLTTMRWHDKKNDISKCCFFCLCYFHPLLMRWINSIIWISIAGPINQCDNNENLIKIIIFAFAFFSLTQFNSMNSVRCKHNISGCVYNSTGLMFTCL